MVLVIFATPMLKSFNPCLPLPNISKYIFYYLYQLKSIIFPIGIFPSVSSALKLGLLAMTPDCSVKNCQAVEENSATPSLCKGLASPKPFTPLFVLMKMG